MPANRSRTERWRECLDQIRERGGAIELSRGGVEGADLIWRVRLLEVGFDSLFIEQPSALGKPVEFPAGSEVVGMMNIGQNRWMFRTRVGESGPIRGGTGRGSFIRLDMPTTVERVQRRAHYRVGCAELHPPRCAAWVITDPSSVIVAEIAARQAAADPAPAGTDIMHAGVLPEVGPMYSGFVANIGGGGIGLVLDRNEAASFDRARMFWLRIDLSPTLVRPVAVAARAVHTHIDSTQRLYAGMSFEFPNGFEHQDFVADQIAKFAGAQTPRAEAA